jgi:competence protein ComEC
VSPFLFDSTLPANVAIIFLLPLAVAALWRVCRLYCILPVFFLITTLAINDRLEQRLPLSISGSEQVLSGIIANLPESRNDATRFIFRPDAGAGYLPSKILVYWYESRDRAGHPALAVPTLHAGERWRLNLKLRPPRGRVNFSGADSERWYFADGIDALAYVQDGENLRLEEPGHFNLQHWRETVLDKLARTAGEIPAFRMVAALAIADRRGLRSHDRKVLSATGTGHLLAISGLHIGLAAALGFYLARLCLVFIPYGFRQQIAIVLPWVMAWLAALAYSGLSGFGVSTQRALIMLTVASVVMLGRRNVHPLLAWLIAMALVLLLDPFAPLRAGFWFSFVAVAVLMLLFVPRYGQMPAWKRVLLAQLGISMVMAPLGMYWFQQASLPGLLANLVAIPVVSLLVVPLILLALPLLWAPGRLAEWLLTIAGYAAHGLFQFLEQLAALQLPMFAATRAPGLPATILAMLGAAMLLFPRGFYPRFAGLLLMIPMLLPVTSVLDHGDIQIDFLDVGQGLSTMLTTREYQLVYDTGPGNGLDGEEAWSMVAGTLEPMIRASGRSPDLVVASHADLDHAGGLQALMALYPGASYIASLPQERDGIRPCMAPAAWKVRSIEFRILHPTVGLPYLGNDSSCVISVKGEAASVLLSGDISKPVERRLVNNGLGQHDILTVPHHGSSTSSSGLLIKALDPDIALISAAMDNRFGFPREDVINRYAQAQVRTLNTAQCGGIRITTSETGNYEVEFARNTRKAIWRWSPGKACR